MNSESECSQKDLFSYPTAHSVSSVVLVIKGIQAPRTPEQVKRAKESGTQPDPNYHIPSFKNSKRWVTKTPRGKPLERPMLITSPEFQDWKAKAVESLISQLSSMSLTGNGETQPGRSRLLQMLSLLPEDDSVNFLVSGSWKVQRVPPGQEGCQITITRLK